ncbi:PRC and DUF2382 domain-containing protein [Streptomyces sp. NPDC047002]|uniref:PRC and DUF2382 domain-containing protein n=1 Tax=Streptomyces sp. NPDC047002 TaxID=3155475 RepID=UPI003453EFBA
MITQEQIPAVLDHPVYDADGNKIGSAKHVFYDDATGNPEWVTVKTGMFGSSESFIPVHDANLVQDHLEVPYDRDQVKDAPNVDIDAGGHLSEQEEHRLYRYYGLDGGGAGDQRQAGRHATTDAGPDARGGAAAMGGAGAVGAGTRGDSAALRQSRTGGTSALGKEGAGRGDAAAEDVAMTRSEERMHVTTERRDAGQARLHKYVVTEEQQQTVPVRHEEVRVVREPITEENRDAALHGDDISEADHVVTLHEERPVVEMHTEPVERVRLTTEEKVEQQTVKGTVRKERIEAETTTEDGKKGHIPGRGDTPPRS